jgi:hypothetical protein
VSGRTEAYAVVALGCGHRWLENAAPDRNHRRCQICGQKGYGVAFGTDRPKADDTFLTREDLLLGALHLWLHREGGDEDLLMAWRVANTHGEKLRRPSLLPDPISVTEDERLALDALATWASGKRVDLIGACEGFHSLCNDSACHSVDERVVDLDGRCAFGWQDRYERPDVVPLIRKRDRRLS